MAIWLVRAGSGGEYEQRFLAESKVYVTWDSLDVNLAKLKSQEELRSVMADLYADVKPNTVKNWASQVWPFAHDMQKGDLVVVPFKSQPVVYIGEVVGDYQHIPNGTSPFFHSRQVKWIGEAIPRTNFSQDLLYSFGAFMTICRIQRNNAEERIKAMRAEALRTYGLIFDALDYSCRSIWITPSVEAMRDYVELVAITLDFEDADSLHILVSEAHPESRTPIQSMWDHLERLRAVVRNSALDLTEAKRCTDMLWKHFRNQGWIVGCGKPVVLTEEQEIHHALTLPGAGAEEIAEINFLIANALVEIGASDNFLKTIIYGATGSTPTGSTW